MNENVHLPLGHSKQFFRNSKIQWKDRLELSQLNSIRELCNLFMIV
jgi:hypothetical protein